MKVMLTVTAGPMEKKAFEFEDAGGFTFGRVPDCTCVVTNDDTFSRHHFILEINPPNVTLKDLGSLNGTYVNGAKYGGRAKDVAPEDAALSEPIPLRDGDQIAAGAYSLRLTIDAPALCVSCGQEIPTDKRKAAEFVGGTYLCGDCRNKEERKKLERQRQAAAPRPIRRAEVKINMDQRMKAEKNAAAVVDELMKLFQRAEDKQDIPVLGNYAEMTKIGEGGFGAVYRAVRKDNGETVAVKTMLQTRTPTARQLLMFEREKYIVSQLRHPNIVRCGDTGCCGDVHFIEMEYLSGGSVWDMMKNGGKVPLDEAVPIMLQTLEGLAYAHQAVLTVQLKSGEKTVRGIVHRDLKPPNILLGGSSNNRIAKVSDFGLSKAFSEAGMTKGSVTADVGDCCGSPPYMAPEHVVNYKYVKPSTDVFEIAATFYHMLTGVPVWRPRRGVEIIKVILEESVTPIRKQDSRIPKKLGDVLDRALARNAGARYQDAGEMLKAMRKAV